MKRLQETQCNVINVTSLLRHGLLINMPFTSEDRLPIKLLRWGKGWRVKRICKGFLTRSGQSLLLEIICKIDITNSISRKTGSGRLRTVRTEQNIERVAELIWRYKNNPWSSKGPTYVEKLTGISRSSVRRIVGLDVLKDRVCITCWASLDQRHHGADHRWSNDIFFVDNNIISKTQQGFLKRLSTTTNLLESFNDWTATIEAKKSVTVIYSDFAKAFDTEAEKAVWK